MYYSWWRLSRKTIDLLNFRHNHSFMSLPFQYHNALQRLECESINTFYCDQTNPIQLFPLELYHESGKSPPNRLHLLCLEDVRQRSGLDSVFRMCSTNRKKRFSLSEECSPSLTMDQPEETKKQI